MKVVPTLLPGVLVVEPTVHGDGRGFFAETWRQDLYGPHGIGGPFAQDSHSRSTRGVVRGLHWQCDEPLGKLVSVARGRILDVAVDIRRGSPHFGQWCAVELDGQSCRQVWVPPGFAHGFCVLSEVVDVIYKFTTPWRAELARGVRWDDPAIGIRWPEAEPLVSAGDERWPTLDELDASDLPRWTG